MPSLRRHWRWAVPSAAAAAVVATATVTLGPWAGAETQPSAAEWKVVHGSLEDGGQYRSLAAAGGQAWAFGSKDAQTDGETRISHFNGEEWEEQEAPEGVTFTPSLSDASSPEDVWAVSDLAEDGAQLIRYDGEKWGTVDSGFGDAGITAIEAVAPGEFWALSGGADQPDLKRFDGSSWTDLEAPKGVTALSSAGADQVYAAGGDPEGAQPTVEQWDGEAWQSMEFPEVDLGEQCYGTSLDAVKARAADDVWAAGSLDCAEENENEYSKPLLGHWDGKQWDVTVGDKSTTGYTDIADDGDGGVWLASYNMFTQVTADGKTSEHPVGDSGLEVQSLNVENLDGTTMLGSGSQYEDGDPDVPQNYGVVFGYGV